MLHNTIFQSTLPTPPALSTSPTNMNQHQQQQQQQQPPPPPPPPNEQQQQQFPFLHDDQFGYNGSFDESKSHSHSPQSQSNTPALINASNAKNSQQKLQQQQQQQYMMSQQEQPQQQQQQQPQPQTLNRGGVPIGNNYFDPTLNQFGYQPQQQFQQYSTLPQYQQQQQQQQPPPQQPQQQQPQYQPYTPMSTDQQPQQPQQSQLYNPSLQMNHPYMLNPVSQTQLEPSMNQLVNLFTNVSLGPTQQMMPLGLTSSQIPYDDSLNFNGTLRRSSDASVGSNNSSSVCENDGKCLLRKCPRTHPNGTGFHTPETCPRGVDCPNKTTDCPYKFHTPCAFDGHCTNPKCTFIHKKQVQQPKLCPKDGSCTYRGCGYLHPNGTGEYLHTMCPFGVKCGFQTTSCPYTIHSLSSNNSPVVAPVSSTSPTKATSSRSESPVSTAKPSLLSSTATAFTPIEIAHPNHHGHYHHHNHKLSHVPVSHAVCSRDGECTHRQCELDHPNGRGFIDRMCMRGTACQYQDSTCKFKHGNESNRPQQQQQHGQYRLKHHISH